MSQIENKKHVEYMEKPFFGMCIIFKLCFSKAFKNGICRIDHLERQLVLNGLCEFIIIFVK